MQKSAQNHVLCSDYNLNKLEISQPSPPKEFGQLANTAWLFKRTQAAALQMCISHSFRHATCSFEQQSIALGELYKLMTVSLQTNVRNVRPGLEKKVQIAASNTAKHWLADS